MSEIKLKVEVDLSGWAYEEEISSAVKEAILSEVRIAARKAAKDVRVAVESALLKKRKVLVERALKAVEGEL